MEIMFNFHKRVKPVLNGSKVIILKLHDDNTNITFTYLFSLPI